MSEFLRDSKMNSMDGIPVLCKVQFSNRAKIKQIQEIYPSKKKRAEFKEECIKLQGRDGELR